MKIIGKILPILQLAKNEIAFHKTYLWRNYKSIIISFMPCSQTCHVMLSLFLLEGSQDSWSKLLPIFGICTGVALIKIVDRESQWHVDKDKRDHCGFILWKKESTRSVISYSSFVHEGCLHTSCKCYGTSSYLIEIDHIHWNFAEQHAIHNKLDVSIIIPSISPMPHPLQP